MSDRDQKHRERRFDSKDVPLNPNPPPVPPSLRTAETGICTDQTIQGIENRLAVIEKLLKIDNDMENENVT